MDKKAEYKNAVRQLKQAAETLRRITEKDDRDYDAKYFLSELEQLISGDDGECGISVFVRDHL